MGKMFWLTGASLIRASNPPPGAHVEVNVYTFDKELLHLDIV